MREAPSAAPSCRSAAQLEFWTERVWSDGVQIDQLRALDRLVIRTRNSVYDLIVSPSGGVMLRGGRFFPDYTPVVLLGSSLGGAFLKLGGIYRGFSMEVIVDGTRIVTSPVDTVVSAVPDGTIH